jgi:hypothetical protein
MAKGETRDPRACLDGMWMKGTQKKEAGACHAMPPPSAALWNMLVGRWVALGGGAVWEQQPLPAQGVHQRPLQAAALLFGQEEFCCQRTAQSPQSWRDWKAKKRPGLIGPRPRASEKKNKIHTKSGTGNRTPPFFARNSRQALPSPRDARYLFWAHRKEKGTLPLYRYGELGGKL